MIILENILFFILILLLVFLYGYVIKVIYLYIKQVIKEKILLPKSDIFNILPNTKMKKLLVLVFIFINISMHFVNREKWINDNTTNHQAKEYLATYLDLHFYKKVLNNVFDIDSPIFIPLNLITDQIYKRGIAHLPKNDGEIGYWKFYFYAYMYTRGSGYMPDKNRTKNIQPSTKKQIAILDMMFDISKTFATKRINDKTINLEKYKAFTSVAFYFDQYELWYFGNHRGIGKIDLAVADKVFMNKLYQMLEWTIKLKNEYKQYPAIKKDIDIKYPVLGVSYLAVIIQKSKFLLLEEKYVKNTFSCDDPLIGVYLYNVNKLMQKDSPLYKLSKSQENRVKDFIFHTNRGYSVAFLINKRCNKKASYGYPSNKWLSDYKLIKNTKSKE